MHGETKGVIGAARTPRDSVRILIADDDPTMLELTASMLRRLGYDVITAPDGETALKTFQDSPVAIQLVISDGLMPGLCGPQLLRMIAELSPSTATLLMSGSPGILFAAGGRALAKPFRPETLAARVKGLLAEGTRNSDPKDAQSSVISSISPGNV